MKSKLHMDLSCNGKGFSDGGQNGAESKETGQLEGQFQHAVAGPFSHSPVGSSPYSDTTVKDPVLLRVTKLEDPSNRGPPPSSAKEREYLETLPPTAGIAHGLGICTTALFIFGELVGAGVVTLPNAIYRQGWYGVITLLVGGLASGYAGAQLGWSWTIMQERWPHLYLKHTRKPYPEMGFQIGGQWLKCFVSLCVYVSMFGSACVFLIMASENISTLLQAWFGFRLTFCYWILIIGATLTPLTFLGSPKDFWPVAVGASGATALAIVVIMIAVGSDYSTYKPIATYPVPGMVDFVLGYGAIIFAYTGHPAFPSFQHDMRKPSKFPVSVFCAYTGICLLYIPLGLFAYTVYGAKLGNDPSILHIIPHGWPRVAATVLITMHVIFALIIVANPVNQDLEQAFSLPNGLTWKRILLRTVYACTIIFACESLPSFGMILDIVGGTSLAISAFVFPGSFNLALRYHTRTRVSDCDIPIRWWEWPLNLAVVTIGLLGAVASVYAGVMTIVGHGDLFKLPCYITGDG